MSAAGARQGASRVARAGSDAAYAASVGVA
jgi:hypothetical protein